MEGGRGGAPQGGAAGACPGGGAAPRPQRGPGMPVKDVLLVLGLVLGLVSLWVTSVKAWPGPADCTQHVSGGRASPQSG